jgi:hypothetical protein
MGAVESVIASCGVQLVCQACDSSSSWEGREGFRVVLFGHRVADLLIWFAW